MGARSPGVLDPVLIDQVVNNHRDQTQRCDEKELVKDAALAGSLKMEWVIGPDGRVTSVRQLESSLRSNQVATCVMAAVRTWRFSSPKGGSIYVESPLTFKGVDF